MLEVQMKEVEFYDEKTNTFFTSKPITVKLAHSLISVSKWEGLWKKPFLPSSYHPGMQGLAEEISYIRCMIVGSVPDYVPGLLYTEHGSTITEYISDSQTATTINRIGPGKATTPTITSEVIYYWMVRFSIPFECERWHLGRLITLIDVCNVNENAGDKSNRMNAQDSARYRQQINEARKAAQ